MKYSFYSVSSDLEFVNTYHFLEPRSNVPSNVRYWHEIRSKPMMLLFAWLRLPHLRWVDCSLLQATTALRKFTVVYSSIVRFPYLFPGKFPKTLVNFCPKLPVHLDVLMKATWTLPTELQNLSWPCECCVAGSDLEIQKWIGSFYKRKLFHNKWCRLNSKLI